MRGDSLRDLYAKTLAVIGLGLLGAAGALVDYWPVRSEIPLVADAIALPQVLGPLPDASVQPGAFENTAGSTDRARFASSESTTASDVVPAMQVVAATSGDAREMAIADAPVLASLEVADAEPAFLTSGTALSLPPVSTVAAPADPLPSAPVGGERLSGGVGHKTVRGVGKAGTAIADGFVKVGSAVGSAFGHLKSIF